MNRFPTVLLSIGIIHALLFAGCASRSRNVRPALSQFPSPMAEHIRSHERIPDRDLPGTAFSITGLLPKPVDVYVPDTADGASINTLIIHFHGQPYVARYSARSLEKPVVQATVNLGAGSSVYERPFSDPAVFTALVAAIGDSLEARRIGGDIAHIHLSSFSAGYGAVRALLRDHMARIDSIILLDGLHTDYIPARTVLAEGGAIGTDKLEGFLRFARLSLSGEKRMIITHSEIFPGTYASTTETADYIIDTLGLKRDPVLKWGPCGMQMVSETSAGSLRILGFAGNTAPDHVDHFHGLHAFTRMIFGD